MDFLIAQEKCPLCSSKERIGLELGTAFTTKTNHYIDTIANLHNVNSNLLVKGLSEWQCSQCGTFYLDPWFSKDDLLSLFRSKKQVHRAGWSEFYGDLDRKSDLKESQIIATFEFLRDNGFMIEEYYEVGCPFFGFLLKLNKMREVYGNRNLEESYLEFSKIYFNDNYWGHKPLSIFLKIMYFRLQRFYLHLKNLDLRVRRFNKDETRYDLVPKVLGFEPSNEDGFWMPQGGCIGEQTNCATMLFGMSNVMPVTIKSLNCEQRKIRLVGLHNFLDHAADPAAYIDEILKVSDSILIVTHKLSQIGRQHKFALESNLESYYASFKHIKVTNITSNIYSHFLLEKKEPIDEFYLIQRTSK